MPAHFSAGDYHLEVAIEADHAEEASTLRRRNASASGDGSLSFTSGTTGPAKTLRLSLELHNTRIVRAAAAINVTLRDTLYLIVPLNTATGSLSESIKQATHSYP